MRMRTTSWMALTAILTAGFLACGPGSEREAGGEAVAPDMEQARADFQRRTQERMEALQDEMKLLKDQLGDTDEVPDVQVRIDEWERQYQELEQKLESKEVATIEEWRLFESEVNAALGELRASYDALANDVRGSLG